MQHQLPRMIRRFFVSLCALVCIALVSTNTYAQAEANTGNIQGRVLDPNGAAIPNVNITAKNQDTGIERTTTSGSDGNYRLVLLPPGNYQVTASASGFAKGVYNLTVTVGAEKTLDISLAVGGAIVDPIIVTDAASVVETTRSSVATTVNERSIQNLPINGRNYQDFATLTPGVVRDPRAGDLSVGGQRGTLNNLQVDGVDNNNTFFGQGFGRGGVRPPYQFSEESVQEFQVNQNGFSAEFGRAGGAVINVVTKSGTNSFHGGAFEYFRDESLNANDPALIAQQITQFQQGKRSNFNKRPPSQINQFGGRIGGPIKRDRAFFFFAYDGQRANVPNFIDLTTLLLQPQPVQALLLPKLNTYPIGRNQNVYFGKVDVRLSERNQFNARYNHQGFTGLNNENSGTLSAQEHSGDSLVKSDTISGSLFTTFSPNLINELRLQYGRDKEPGRANSSDPEALINTGAGNLAIGRNNFSPRETTIKRQQVVDNLTLIRGRHAFKFGLDFTFDQIFNFFPGLFSGSYTFPSYAAFLNKAPSAYTQNFPGAGTTGGTTYPDNNQYAFFAQDDWKATPKLTLNLGARYDYQKFACPPVQNTDPLLFSNPLGVVIDTARCPKDGNNIAPRFGFAYDLFGTGRTVVRGGYGIFYGNTPSIVLGTAHSQNGINVTGINLNAAAIASLKLTYPTILSAPPAGFASNPNLFVFAPDFQQPYVQQARIGVEHELFNNLSVAATYVRYRGVHLTRTRDINLNTPVPFTLTGPDGKTYTFLRFPSARPISRASGQSYNRISIFESAANSDYNGLLVQVTKRFSRGLQFIAVYTLSKAMDDKPDATTVVVGADDAKYVQNNLNPRDDYARSDVDLRHRFVFSPVYEFGKFTRTDNRFLRALLSDYTISSIWQFQSGFPYSAVVSGDPNNDGNRSNDRLPGTARNQFTTPAVYQIDARITRSISIRENMRVRLILEGFNIFNRPNIVSVNSTFFNFNGTALTAPAASSAFGTPRSFSSGSTFLSPRQLQLAIKFDF
jgi:outer membrane receptor protein involved in Fe transport